MGILPDSMRVWLLAVILLLLAAASALFSAIETAFFSLQPLQLRRLRTQNPRLADRLSRLLENPRRVLSALLLADATVNVPLIVLSVYTLRTVPQHWVPFGMAAVVIFALIAIVCDLAPKVIALGQPYRLAKIGARVMNVMLPLLDPVARVLQRWSERIADAMTPARVQAHVPLSEEELETLVQLSAEEGILEATESEMIQEILKLGEKVARDCMTPRVDLFLIPDDLTNEEAIARLREGRHRRVPVYGETPDDIVGTLEVTRFLLNPEEHYVEQLHPPSFVPETMKALDLLKSFIRHPQGIAVIVDEYGGTEGVVTLNDIVEEIISDAVPSGEQELYIEPLGEGRVIAAGRTRLDDLAELGFKLEEDGMDTIGGLIFNRTGSVPRVGASFEIDGVLIRVRRSSRRGVEEVLLVRDHADETTGDVKA
jgi:CBS domain containing-hemolysin-like protein